MAAATVAAIGAAMALPAATQTADLGDVPPDAYFAVPVAEFHANGVFNGTLCREGFCPSEPMDRKTMAVWIVRVLDGQDPSTVTESRFDDVDPAGFHARFIERMAELGVTGGCGDGSGFCPDRHVDRAQMAVFISRAYNLPAGPDPGFSDVPDDAWYAADVARLAASRITVGCGDRSSFCPGETTTRGQMATFLWRAENPNWEQSGANDGQNGSLYDEPAGSFDDAHIVSDDAETLRRRVGDFSVSVFLCTPEGRYTMQDLVETVTLLNDGVSPGFSAESSDLLNVRFVEGAVVSVSPPNKAGIPHFRDCAASAYKSLHGVHTAPRHLREWAGSHILIADGYHGGWGGLGATGSADWSVSLAHFGDGTGTAPPGVFPHVVAHELGHSLLDLGHAPTCTHRTLLCGRGFADDKPRPDLSTQTAVASEGQILGDITRTDGLFLSCYFRGILGWPVGGDTPPCALPVPTAPEDLVVESVADSSGGSITISWKPPRFTGGVPVTGYTVGVCSHPRHGRSDACVPYQREVQVPGPRGSTSAWEWESPPVGYEFQLPSDASSYSFEGLAAPAEYSIYLKANSEYGAGADGGSQYFLIPSIDSAQITISDVYATGFTVSWKAVAGADEYRVSHSGVCEMDEDMEALVPSCWLTVQSGTSLTVSGLKPDTEYAVRVWFCGFEVAWSEDPTCRRGEIVTVSTTPAPAAPDALAPPDNIAATGGDTWIDVSWDPVPGAGWYAFCGHWGENYARHGCSNASSNVFIPSTFSGLHIADLDPDTTYDFEVRSCVSESLLELCGPARSGSVTTRS